MSDELLYALVFVLSFAVDVVPIIGPPAWTVMLFFVVRYDPNPWLVLVAGVPGSTLGRYCMSRYIPRFSDRYIKRRKTEELQFVGRKLGQKLWRSWLFVLAYSLTPLSTTALFAAAGIARIPAMQIVPPFFVGKFASDAFMLFTSAYAARGAENIWHGVLSFKGLLAIGGGLVAVATVLFLDWRVLLQERRIEFNFRIWR